MLLDRSKETLRIREQDVWADCQSASCFVVCQHPMVLPSIDNLPTAAKIGLLASSAVAGALEDL